MPQSRGASPKGKPPPRTWELSTTSTRIDPCAAPVNPQTRRACLETRIMVLVEKNQENSAVPTRKHPTYIPSRTDAPLPQKADLRRQRCPLRHQRGAPRTCGLPCLHQPLLDWPGVCPRVFLMKNERRKPPLARRLLTSLVGAAFLFAFVVAQLPFCQCGIVCLHTGGGGLAVAKVVPASEPPGCCPSQRHNDTPLPDPPRGTPCGDQGECPCPVEISASSELPVVPLDALVPSVQIQIQTVALPVGFPGFSTPSGSEDLPRWRPTRGSPLPRAPIHLLNSVHII